MKIRCTCGKPGHPTTMPTRPVAYDANEAAYLAGARGMHLMLRNNGKVGTTQYYADLAALHGALGHNG